MTAAQVAQDLRAAADVLRRDGWAQGDYEKPDGSKCMKGAICTAAAGGVDASDAEPSVWEAYAFMWGYLNAGPVTWNDTPGRTADEVIAALEAAADAAERSAAYDEGRWCGECVYGVVMDPPCCTQGPVPA